MELRVPQGGGVAAANVIVVHVGNVHGCNPNVSHPINVQALMESKREMHKHLLTPRHNPLPRTRTILHITRQTSRLPVRC